MQITMTWRVLRPFCSSVPFSVEEGMLLSALSEVLFPEMSGRVGPVSWACEDAYGSSTQTGKVTVSKPSPKTYLASRLHSSEVSSGVQVTFLLVFGTRKRPGSCSIMSPPVSSIFRPLAAVMMKSFASYVGRSSRQKLLKP